MGVGLKETKFKLLLMGLGKGHEYVCEAVVFFYYEDVTALSE